MMLQRLTPASTELVLENVQETSTPQTEPSPAEGDVSPAKASFRKRIDLWLAQKGRRSTVALHLMGIAFFLVFTADSVVNVLSASLIGGLLGYWCLSIVYITFAVGTLFLSLPIIRIFGPKWAMVLASVAYASFCACYAWPQWWTLIPGGILIGLGAGGLWTGNGIYITAAAAEHGKATGVQSDVAISNFNGIFFGYVLGSFLPGNILSSTLIWSATATDSQSASSASLASGLSSVSSAKIGWDPIYIFLFVLLAIITLFGTLLLSLLPKFEYSQDTRSYKETAFGGLLILLNKPFLVLLPYWFYAGVHTAFCLAEFAACFVYPGLGIEWVGFCGAVWGLGSLVTAYPTGKLMAKFGMQLGTFLWGIPSLVCSIYFILGLTVLSNIKKFFTMLDTTNWHAH